MKLSLIEVRKSSALKKIGCWVLNKPLWEITQNLKRIEFLCLVSSTRDVDYDKYVLPHIEKYVTTAIEKQLNEKANWVLGFSEPWGKGAMQIFFPKGERLNIIKLSENGGLIFSYDIPCGVGYREWRRYHKKIRNFLIKMVDYISKNLKIPSLVSAGNYRVRINFYELSEIVSMFGRVLIDRKFK